MEGRPPPAWLATSSNGARYRVRSILVGALATAVTAFAPAVASGRIVFIDSPSGNIACQLSSSAPKPGYTGVSGALCTVFSSRRQAEVTQRGRVTVFRQGSDPPSEGV